MRAIHRRAIPGRRDVELFQPSDGECKDADFEGLTRAGDVYFAIGSHSHDRKKQSNILTYREDRESLEVGGIDYCASRYQLRSFRLNADGTLMPFNGYKPGSLVCQRWLSASLPRSPQGERYDIEGIAANDRDLYVGFKGPVLRQNYVPILHLDHDCPFVSAESQSPLLFVDLGGRGVRDMTEGPGGSIFILAGPNGNEDQGLCDLSVGRQRPNRRRWSQGGTAQTVRARSFQAEWQTRRHRLYWPRGRRWRKVSIGL